MIEREFLNERLNNCAEKGKERTMYTENHKIEQNKALIYKTYAKILLHEQQKSSLVYDHQHHSEMNV